MMLVPAGVGVHIALGVTDMRKGLDGLAMLVQEVLKQDPFSGQGADRAVASPLQHRPATQRSRIQAASAGDHPKPAHRSVLRSGWAPDRSTLSSSRWSLT